MSSKSPERLAAWAGHIVEQIDRLSAILGDPIDIDRLEQGLNREGAVRCLEIVSEATARLHRAGVDLPQLEPQLPWADIRQFGNVIRHDYPDVRNDLVEQTLLDDLGPLRAAALRLKVRFEAEAS